MKRLLDVLAFDHLPAVAKANAGAANNRYARKPFLLARLAETPREKRMGR